MRPYCIVAYHIVALVPTNGGGEKGGEDKISHLWRAYAFAYLFMPPPLRFPRSCIHRACLMHTDICAHMYVHGENGRRAGAVRRHRQRSITRGNWCACARRPTRRRGMKGRTGKRMAEKGRRRWTVKRHHKSLPAVSPHPTVLALLLHRHLVHRPSRYSLPPYGIRTVSRHRPPRALYGPGRSEMVACLSGSLRAAVKAADLVSRRSPAKSHAAKKMRRRSQVFSGSFRRTKRRRCPPPCQGSIPRRRCIPIGIPRMRTRGKGV